MWFNGGVTDAVKESVTREAVFVVYVYDAEEESSTMTKVVESSETNSLLGTDGGKFVCIKVSRGTDEFTQFGQIYPIVKTPCVYFIGKNGVPLSIVSGVVSQDQFLSTIQEVTAKHTGVSTPVETPVTETASGVTRVSSGAESSESSVRENLADTNAAQEGATSASAVSDPEKLNRVQELLEKRRAEKEQEMIQKEKEQEMERRRVGQELQKFKDWQSDEERRKIAAERKRDRQEEINARERVLAQIEQDRKERAARFNQVRADETKQEDEEKQRILTEERVKREAELAEQSLPEKKKNKINLVIEEIAAMGNFSKIFHKCFRSQTERVKANGLPSRRHVRKGRLSGKAEVRAHVRTQVVPKNPSLRDKFKLCTLYPRRTFDEQSDGETLRALQLAPTAVLLVLPVSPPVPALDDSEPGPENRAATGRIVINNRSNQSSPISGVGRTKSDVVASTGSGVTKIFWWAVQPILTIFEYVSFFIFGTPTNARSWGRTDSNSTVSPRNSAEESRVSAGGSDSAAGIRRRNIPSQGRVLRQEGNIRKFANPGDVSADDGDGKDDDGTWNGNSTQQL
ncbi:unnamed protein product [Notodromas monacha]|uniref:UBX domain-containing protein 4 n=1 Tax=Notodromas monacha TaxID=399045 RepID=A0A7R9BSJ2_9CRUS|nr:unnamed protein product [Notodromas monacha]CAG0920917.1 unnamed protein product [Notodromas monacha]